MKTMKCKIKKIDCGYSKLGISVVAELNVLQNKDNIPTNGNFLSLVIGKIDFMIQGTEKTKPIQELQLPLEVTFLNIIELLTSYGVNKLSELVGKQIELVYDEENNLIKKNYLKD